MANRLGTIDNLETNGSYDILFVSFPSGFPEGKLGFEFTNTPRKVTGVQKVAQLFIYVLLTSKGADPVRPNFGTDFVKYIVGGNRDSDLDQTYSDVATYVNDAEGQVKSILNSRRADLSSQLSSIRLLSVTGASDSITLTIKVVTRNGEEAAVAIPFPQLDLGLSNG